MSDRLFQQTSPGEKQILLSSQMDGKQTHALITEWTNKWVENKLEKIIHSVIFLPNGRFYWIGLLKICLFNYANIARGTGRGGLHFKWVFVLRVQGLFISRDAFQWVTDDVWAENWVQLRNREMLLELKWN